MAYDLVTAAQALKHVSLASLGTILSAISLVAQASGAASVQVQLRQTHRFLYLEIPLWWFFAASIVLSFIGAFLALTTDTLRGKGTALGKFLTATIVGLLCTFVFLPAVVDEPNVVAMMLTSLGGSFSGTVLLYLLARFTTDDNLHEALLKILREKAIATLEFIASLCLSLTVCIIYKMRASADGKRASL